MFVIFNRLIVRRFFKCVALLLVTIAFGRVDAVWGQTRARVPGVVIAKTLNPKSQVFTSAGFVILPNGDYLASYAWGGTSVKGKPMVTKVLHSSDKGVTWKALSEIQNLCWSNFVFVGGKLYLLGADGSYGRLVIVRSDDLGKTWTQPNTADTGLLSNGKNYFTFGTSFFRFRGRVWRSVDRFVNGRFQSMVISANENDDLLKASRWQITNRVTLDRDLFGPEGMRSRGRKSEIREGELSVDENGKLSVLFRMVGAEKDTALLMRVNSRRSLVPNLPPETIVKFPGGHRNFGLVYDAKNSTTWAIGNAFAPTYAVSNRLVLAKSKDLVNWETTFQIVEHRDSRKHGIGQVVMDIDGDDLVGVAFAAWNGARGEFAPNYMTFLRVENFRNLSIGQSPALLGKSKSRDVEFANFVLSGEDYELERFRSGMQVFNDRKLKWTNIDGDLPNLRFVQRKAGMSTPMTVRIKTKCKLFLVVAKEKMMLDLTGWVYEPELEVGRSDRQKTMVFSRQAKPDEELVLPQTSRSSGILLVPN